MKDHFKNQFDQSGMAAKEFIRAVALWLTVCLWFIGIVIM